MTGLEESVEDNNYDQECFEDNRDTSNQEGGNKNEDNSYQVV